jgi:tetratricopeptide (TPR) repeat protein
VSTLTSIAILLVVFIGAAWVVRRQWREAESGDRGTLALKIGVTALLLLYIAFDLVPGFRLGGRGAAFSFLVTISCVILLFSMWGRELLGSILSPVGNLFDGGGQAPEHKPLYSIAQAKRRRGDFAGALEEIERQLERFPGDFEGRMLRAEIQMENLNDPGAAVQTVEELLQLPGLPPHQVAGALFALADWQLGRVRDPAAARVSLERVAEIYPDSELARRARQRIAHLPTADLLAHRDLRPGIQMREGLRDLGLRPQSLPDPEPDAATKAARLVQQLEQHPGDHESREQLAILYAEALGRPDLARMELEQLAADDLASQRQAVHWLNLLANLQLRFGRDTAGARLTLQKLVDRFPDSAAAAQARLQMETLGRGPSGPETKEPGLRPGSSERD